MKVLINKIVSLTYVLTHSFVLIYFQFGGWFDVEYFHTDRLYTNKIIPTYYLIANEKDEELLNLQLFIQRLNYTRVKDTLQSVSHVIYIKD